MTEEESLGMIQARLKQLEEEVQTRSKHKNPMFYAALNNLRWCRIVDDLLNGIAPDPNDVNAVCGVKQARTTQPSSNINLTKEIAPGVNAMDILNKYRDIEPDIHNKLSKAVKDAGYVVQGFYIREK